MYLSLGKGKSIKKHKFRTLIFYIFIYTLPFVIDSDLFGWEGTLKLVPTPLL